MDLAIVMLLVMVVLILLLLISSEMHEDDYLGVYECGFDSMVEARLWFSYRFFLLGVLFIVFDVEVSLLLVVPYMEISIWYVVLMSLFIFILLMGTVYEIEMGSMDWL